MNKNSKMMPMLVLAIILGMLIGWVDSSPHWDDAGITAVSLILVSASFGFYKPKRAWLFALAIGIWVPFFNFIHSYNLDSLPVLIITFAAAYAGAALSKLFTARIS